jgi:ankyrin repeat protein
MSDALRLPARPSLEFYRKLAKDFQRAARSSNPEAIRAWGEEWRARTGTEDVNLPWKFEELWRRLVKEKPKFATCALTDAQFFLAQVHGFASWPIFAKHIDALARAASGTAVFESAVDAVVSGNAATLRRLLHDHPGLVRERSTREHHATLLHYVSANGVEDFRQKTPKNIVEIARMLLDAGADVNAESNSYGGHDRTFDLTATSVHPEAAGVQEELLMLLLERGAAVAGDPGIVNACLHNGRGRAAVFCAARGATLDLEGAAGVGNVDVIRTFFDASGQLTNGATQKQLTDGFAWACQFGRTAAVEFLLNHGIPLDAELPHDGQSGLHWAAFGGHPDAVRLLLARGASATRRERTYNGTPLDWAIYAWGNRGDLTATDAENFYEVVSLLAGAGASLDPNWLDEGDDADRGRAKRKLLADPRMRAALGSA